MLGRRTQRVFWVGVLLATLNLCVLGDRKASTSSPRLCLSQSSIRSKPTRVQPFTSRDEHQPHHKNILNHVIQSRGDASLVSNNFRVKKTGRLCINLVLWWLLNVMFNLANKQCLNNWPHPWMLAVLHLAVGSACILTLWLPLPRLTQQGLAWKSIRTPPSLKLTELRELLPIAVMLSVGHVTSTLAPAYGTVAFSNIIKTAEPLFTCLFSFIISRRIFSPSVYLSLLMVVLGVALVSTRDINFSSFSLMAGMVSNAAFAMYSIYAKATINRSPKLWTPLSTYACLTLLSCVILTPLSVLMECTKIGASRLVASDQQRNFVGSGLVKLLVLTGVLQYLSNEIAFCTLSMIHPVTYAVANTLKRSIVVGASLIFFRQKLPLSAALGAGLAIFGAMMYSLSMSCSQK